ncbi:MAG: hypothetical protein H6823_16355 [Planctomycetaceae bacterium]|nr:hypothetical protein [Planctomycetales bacterium]MCB9939812.1 hypothetical protein [Planctomycetaceae bacterium]
MDRLQGELETTYPILNIQIVGLNEFGQDPAGANDLMMASRTTPWLQDGDSNGNQRSDVWYDKWNVTYRDVIVLNGQNEMTDVYNLTSHDLGVAANYATMRDKLIDAAMTEQKPWQNHRDRFDINDDGFVVPGDVLIMINDINANGPRDLLPPTTTSLAAPYYDCSGDNYFSPIDILQVINFIEGTSAEGEATSESDVAMQIATVAIASPVPSLSSGFEVTLASNRIVAVSVAMQVDPTGTNAAPRSESSAEDNSESRESAPDDFWAEYWPSL